MNWKYRSEQLKNKRFTNAQLISRIFLWPFLTVCLIDAWYFSYTKKRKDGSMEKVINKLPKDTDFDGLNTHKYLKRLNSNPMVNVTETPLFSPGYYDQSKRFDNEHVRNQFEILSLKEVVREKQLKDLEKDTPAIAEKIREYYKKN